MALYAFDGTRNSDLHGPRRHTNVLKFYNAYNGAKSYFRGIGNKHDYGAIMQIVGGVSGLGGKGIIADAYAKLAKHLKEGDEDPIDIVGFSRGAALALHFANVVKKRGIPILKTRRRIVKHRRIVGRKRPKVTWHYEYDYRQTARPIRFLGLWDTVASFGFPGNDINLGYDLGVPKSVKKACHAMALDEYRKSFQITRLDGAEEAWFMGRHSNVGGGFPDLGLSDIALEWMVERGRQCSLEFFETHLKGVKPNPLGAMPDTKRKPNRVVRSGDKAHKSVMRGDYANINWTGVKSVS